MNPRHVFDRWTLQPVPPEPPRRRAMRWTANIAAVVAIGLLVLPADAREQVRVRLRTVATAASGGDIASVITNAGRRSPDWSAAGATIIDRSTICSSLTSSATRAQINTAITNCSNSGGGVVSLGAGTYSLNGDIQMKNNVTLRGAGPGSSGTILNFTSATGDGIYGNDVAFKFEGPNAYFTEDTIPSIFGAPHGPVTWTGTNGSAGTYTQGATVLNLGSTPTGLAVGDMIVLAQNNDTTGIPKAGWFTSARTNGGAGGAISDEGSGEITEGLHQRHRVAAVSGTQVTIDAPGIIAPAGTWQTALSPRAWWFNNADDAIHDAGVEYLRIVTTSISGEFLADMDFHGAANCWMKGVGLTPKTGTAGSDFGVLIGDSRNISIINSWFGPKWGGGAGGNTTSYAISVKASSHVRIENNIFDQAENALVPAGAGANHVFLYNFDRWTGLGSSTGEGGLQNHSVGSIEVLVEGNRLEKIWMDYFHGPASHFTFYRNHTVGNGIDLASYNRWINIIGNVLTCSTHQSLGNSGSHDRFASVCFRMGYPCQTTASSCVTEAGGSNTLVADSVVWTSVMRWGNHLSFNNTTRWEASEVPTTDGSWPTNVPASQTLPASAIYSSAPGYFTISGVGTVTWPPIGPDVSGGDFNNGKAYKIPAERMYDFCGGNIANFDPTRYGS